MLLTHHTFRKIPGSRKYLLRLEILIIEGVTVILLGQGTDEYSTKSHTELNFQNWKRTVFISVLKYYLSCMYDDI